MTPNQMHEVRWLAGLHKNNDDESTPIAVLALKRLLTDYDALVAAAIKACSDMGCYCAADHDDLLPEQFSPICELGALVASQKGKY